MKASLWLLVGWLGVCVAVGAEEKASSGTEPKREHHQMTDEQRAQAELRANEAWQKLTVQEKLQLVKLQRALREMPAEERKFIHERIEHFLTMSPDERGKLKQNNERWKQMTPEEREQARQQFHKKRQELEAKWRREHPGQEPPPFLTRGHKNSVSNAPAATPAPASSSQP